MTIFYIPNPTQYLNITIVFFFWKCSTVRMLDLGIFDCVFSSFPSFFLNIDRYSYCSRFFFFLVKFFFRSPVLTAVTFAGTSTLVVIIAKQICVTFDLTIKHTFKGTIHPQMKIRMSFNVMLFNTCMTFFFLWHIKEDILKKSQWG